MQHAQPLQFNWRKFILRLRRNPETTSRHKKFLKALGQTLQETFPPDTSLFPYYYRNLFPGPRQDRKRVNGSLFP